MACKFKIGEEVIWHNGEGIFLAAGIITGVKYTSPLGSIYKVDILYNDKKIRGALNKNIHEKFLTSLTEIKRKKQQDNK